MPEGFDTKSASVQELTERQLKWGYWFVVHRDQLKRLLVIALISLSVILFGFSLFRVVQFYVFEQDDYVRLLGAAATDYIDIEGIHQLNRIEEMQVISRQVIAGTGGNVDVVARVRNPNAKWALKSFTYRFAVGTTVLPEEQGFLLPGEEKFLFALNVRAPASGTPQLLIDNEQWQRVILYEKWGPERLAFKITEKAFTPARSGELSGQLPISEASATLTNTTAYNYNQVDVQIGLYSGNRLVAVNLLPLPNFTSGQVRTLSSRWTVALGAVSTVEIIPTVNILDLVSYRDFEGKFDPAFLEVEKRF
ncbi:MAG: hypothetical protein HY461_03060 [Parcubacteria group bacterium]|nr:hypothetical protein [Parcubacteria group bacterium]